MHDPRLSGRTIAVPDAPACFAFDRAGATLAVGTGSGPLHLVDVASGGVRSVKLSNTIRSLLFSDDGAILYAGVKAMTTVDPVAAKKGKIAFKGLKDAPNDLDLADDGATLVAAGGSFIATDDCFVRAFAAATGALRWKAKLAAKSGVSGVVAIGDRIAATGDHGALHLLEGATGAAAGALALVSDPPRYSRPLGGVARCRGGALVVSVIRDGVPSACFVEADAGGPRLCAEVAMPIAGSDRGVSMISSPMVHGDRALVIAGDTVRDYARWTALVVDTGACRLIDRHVLADASHGRHCALSTRGELAWAAAGAVRIAAI